MTDCEVGVLIGNLSLQSFITILQSLLNFQDYTILSGFLEVAGPCKYMKLTPSVTTYPFAAHHISNTASTILVALLQKC